MRLSAKTLERLFKGAICFKEEKGWLTPYRYSRKQLDYMEDKEYDWGWRMRAKFTGPVRIEFKTDATRIAFDYQASHEHERANTIDLYVNGVLTAVHKIGENLKGSVDFSLSEGNKKVAIYMPCESEIKLKGFEINGSYKSVKEKGKRLLIFGDSITQGAGTDFASGAYANELQRLTGYNILSQGIGGYRFEPRDLVRVEGFEPDMLLVFLGTNYYDTECEKRGYDYAKATKEYFEKVTSLYPNIPIYAITPLFRTNADEWERFLWCIETIKNECARHEKITTIDGFSIMPCVDECLADGVHPNAYGAKILAENLAKIIK